MKFTDLNRILRSKNFLHKDGQLRAVHVILGFKPLSKRFQSPKNVIRAKDLWLALTDPPLARTQDVELLAPLIAKLLYSQEPPIPSDEEAKEPTPKPI